MMRVAINGLGRIGRATLKIVASTPGLELAAINDPAPPEDLAHLLNHDTVYGRYQIQVKADGDGLVIADRRYPAFTTRDPRQLPWKRLGIDVVFESSGQFRTRSALAKHLEAGAKRVILSAPAKDEDIPTVIYGVNAYDEKDGPILSCASSTTHCVAPIVEILNRHLGVQKAMMTTTHAYTASQALVDGPHKRNRRGRAAAANIVPTTTGAAVATTRVFPELGGLFEGVAVRVPVPICALSDMVMLTARETNVIEVNEILQLEARSDRYAGVVGVTKEPIVSSDVIQNSHASIVDAELTQVVGGNLVKIMSWYDNEWGYASQMVRQAVSMALIVPVES
jgi:glyceraldehyde 3-phosphate dehydrogenase